MKVQFRKTGKGMPAADEIYRELIEPIEEKMIRAIVRIVRDADDAEDTLRNALSSIWRNLKWINRHPNPQGYVMRTCISAAIDVIRKRNRIKNREMALKHDSVTQSDPESILIAREKAREVMNAIASLPPQQAEAVLMRVLLEENYGSIALVIGCSEVTARSHISKGKERLRDMLSDGNRHPVTEEIQ